MPSQFSADCLNEIFAYLKDKMTLHSCLLVNRHWCEVSVRILWKRIQNYDTLIACLPSESREILFKNEIVISTPTSKPPLFNYVAFVKNLSINEIVKNILRILQTITSKSFDDNKSIIVTQEMFKMLMNQISLKTLDFYYLYFPNSKYFSNISFTTYPGAMDCLRKLSELNCGSDISSDRFHQLSQICHHIQSLKITFEG